MTFRLTNPGASVWKLALIPALAGILFKVTRPASTDVDPTTAATAAHDAQASSPVVAEKKTPEMPEFSLTDALRFDPFASLSLPEKPAPAIPLESEAKPESTPPAAAPASPPVPAPDPIAERASTLKQLKVSAVFPSSKGAMAIIDSKAVRAGDWLSPGVRVVEIRDHDVVLRVEDGEPARGKTAGEPATR